MSANERVLRNFIRIGAIPQKVEGDGEHFLPMPSDNLDKGRVVTRFEPADKGNVVQGGLPRSGRAHGAIRCGPRCRGGERYGTGIVGDHTNTETT